MVTYPSLNDPLFYEKIRNKREFIEPNVERIFDDIYCYKPHQRFLMNYLNPKTPYKSILLFHAMGTGKTMSAIGISEMYRNSKTRIYFLAKNGLLLNNFKSQLKHGCERFEVVPQNYTLETFNTFIQRMVNVHSVVKKPNPRYKLPDNSVVIIDEVHNAINSSIFECLKIVRRNTKNVKFILLSATPMYDSVKDIFNVLELLTNKEYNISQNPELFESEYHLSEKGKEFLKHELVGYVSYMDIDNSILPNVHRQFIECEPSQHQLQGLYESQKLDDTLHLKEIAASLIVYPDNSFHVTEQYGDFLSHENIQKYSSKLYNLYHRINPNGKNVIYSNFVKMSSGINLIESFIKYNFSNQNIFTIPDSAILSQKLKAIKNFNKVETGILLCTSTISEGITLRNVTDIHIMDPHWNYARLNQFVGRSVRTYSHDNPQTSNVNVYYYKINNYQDIFIDELKYSISTQKMVSIEEVEKLLIAKSIDCFLRPNAVCDPPVTLPQNMDISTYVIPDKLQNHIIDTIKNTLNTIDLYINITELQNAFSDYNLPLNDIKKLIQTLDKTIVKNVNNLQCHVIVLDTFILLSPIGKQIYSSVNNLQPVYQEKIKDRKFRGQQPAKKKLKLDRFLDIPHAIFATYTNKFGETDDNLRIVDNSELIDTGDNRHVNPGKVISTFTLKQLKIIGEKLNITNANDWTNKTQAIAELTGYFVSNELIF